MSCASGADRAVYCDRLFDRLVGRSALTMSVLHVGDMRVGEGRVCGDAEEMNVRENNQQNQAHSMETSVV